MCLPGRHMEWEYKIPAKLDLSGQLPFLLFIFLSKKMFLNNFTHLFLAVLGLRCCAGFSLVAVSRATL